VSKSALIATGKNKTDESTGTYQKIITATTKASRTKKIKNNHVKTAEQDGFSREVDFCQYGFGGIEGADRALNRIDEDLPQQRAHHGKGGIGHASADDGSRQKKK
jgi:hypothetical protein